MTAKTGMPASVRFVLGLLCVFACVFAASAAELRLTGDQEVPPVSSSAKGVGMISVSADGAVSGSVSTSGLSATMAHIHMAAAGKNGPVIIPLAQGADGAWSVPPGAKLTVEQLKGFMAGELYVNVHSAEHKGGEIRAQLSP